MSTNFSTNVFGVQLPSALSNAPEEGGICNVPAIILIVMCALLLIRGVSESAKTNAIMVAIKLVVLVMFIVIGFQGFDSQNLQPFAPYGVSGVATAASIIFFTFVGLDGVAAAGEEAKDPHRNLPLAILISLVTVTVMYVLVALVAVAAQPAGEFEGQEAGLAKILENVTGASWPGTVLAAGAIISIFSVTLVSIYGQTRILFAMSRDGMIPEVFHKVNPRTLTPIPNTIIVAVVISLLAGFIPISFLAEMTSVGTLVAFVTVSIGVIDSAATRAGPAAQLQGSAVSADPDPVDRRRPVDHQQPADCDAVRVRDLGRCRICLVSRLRAQPLAPR